MEPSSPAQPTTLADISLDVLACCLYPLDPHFLHLCKCVSHEFANAARKVFHSPTYHLHVPLQTLLQMHFAADFVRARMANTAAATSEVLREIGDGDLRDYLPLHWALEAGVSEALVLALLECDNSNTQALSLARKQARHTTSARLYLPLHVAAAARKEPPE